VTIAFLGPVGEEAAREAWSALAWPLSRVEATLAEVVPLGDPRRPSALCALLDGARAEVEAAMTARRGACWDAAGARHEDRAAKAHLTLARPARRATDEERARAVTWAAGLRLGYVALTLDRVALFGPSEGDGSGPRYRIVASAALAPPS
jgi:2'-5' RNA ligase